jgi:hypothetical protein
MSSVKMSEGRKDTFLAHIWLHFIGGLMFIKPGKSWTASAGGRSHVIAPLFASAVAVVDILLVEA